MSYGPKQTILEGFNKFVIKKEGCWDWSGCVPPSLGYGQLRSEMKIVKAHRASWIIHFGEIPKGMCVCHKCDNKRCSNPDHLFLGTQKDNNLDMIKKGYHPTLAKKGTKNHMAKLDNKKVRKIKKLLLSKKFSQAKIARMFDITPMIISKIKHNILWKEIA